MGEQASNFVGSVPESYDRYLGPRIFKDFAGDLAARVVARQPGSVLELAAGTGIVSRKLRDALPDACTLLATDLNEPMLTIARQKFREEESIEFRDADALSLPLPDASFDTVACQFGVMFFPDKLQSYREVARVLKPGGHYVFNAWGPLANNPFADIANRTVARLFPDNPPGFYQVPFGYHDTGDIEATLLEAGFAEVNSQFLNLESSATPVTDFARGLVFGNPLEEEVNDRGGDAEAVCAVIGDALTAELPEPMPLQALVVEARLA